MNVEEEYLQPIYTKEDTINCIYPCAEHPNQNPNNCICAICYCPNSCMIKLCSREHAICVYCVGTMILRDKLNINQERRFTTCFICAEPINQVILTNEICQWILRNKPPTLDLNENELIRFINNPNNTDTLENDRAAQQKIIIDAQRKRINARLDQMIIIEREEREEILKNVLFTLIYNFLLNNVGISPDTLNAIIIRHNVRINIIIHLLIWFYRLIVFHNPQNYNPQIESAYKYILIIIVLRYFIWCDFTRFINNIDNDNNRREDGGGYNRRNRKSRRCRSSKSCKSRRSRSGKSRRSKRKGGKNIKQNNKNIFQIYPILKVCNFTLEEASDLQNNMTDAMIKLYNCPNDKLEKFLQEHSNKLNNSEKQSYSDGKGLNGGNTKIPFFEKPDYKEKIKNGIIYYKNLINEFANRI